MSDYNVKRSGLVLDLNGLEQMHREAQPGPWDVRKRDTWWSVVDAKGATVFDDGTAGDEYNQECSNETRDYIIAMHAALPELLAAARRGARLREALQEILTIAPQSPPAALVCNIIAAALAETESKP